MFRILVQKYTCTMTEVHVLIRSQTEDLYVVFGSGKVNCGLKENVHTAVVSIKYHM